VGAARALLCTSSLEFGGVGIYNSEDRRIFSDLSEISNCIRARPLRQSKANKYRIIDRKVGDEHRREAEIQ
jgi:hypothetical protein